MVLTTDEIKQKIETAANELLDEAIIPTFQGFGIIDPTIALFRMLDDGEVQVEVETVLGLDTTPLKEFDDYLNKQVEEKGADAVMSVRSMTRYSPKPTSKFLLCVLALERDECGYRCGGSRTIERHVLENGDATLSDTGWISI